jgi:COMPASS component SPP1
MTRAKIRDRCDNWYHPACVGISEAKLELIDMYICKSCERSECGMRFSTSAVQVIDDGVQVPARERYIRLYAKEMDVISPLRVKVQSQLLSIARLFSLLKKDP